MDMNLINKVTAQQLKPNIPTISSGDTIKVHFQIKEGNKSRIQVFEGVIIKTQGSGISSSVLVRKTTGDVSTERIFPVHSPLVKDIEVVKYGKVRRARIYYMRERRGKAARIKELIVKK
ncbi:50S ribosomal protein L19 [Spiroplasma endosymbiont of Amphibalanus improvisus]|uniref:50S ribosomal protein L19 n=1 Tax=Spiroplasma endosymbiont of Amphibalanus improvisus TaxID=3066327 RepID=UPI003CC79FD0